MQKHKSMKTTWRKGEHLVQLIFPMNISNITHIWLYAALSLWFYYNVIEQQNFNEKVLKLIVTEKINMLCLILVTNMLHYSIYLNFLLSKLCFKCYIALVVSIKTMKITNHIQRKRKKNPSTFLMRKTGV